MGNDASPLDRGIQIEILRALAACYPRQLGEEQSRRLISQASDWQKVVVNAAYLGELGLIEPGLLQIMGPGGYEKSIGLAKITARGLDFLADDGGLGAMLGVVTVKFHAETLQSLLTVAIEASSLSAKEKQTFSLGIRKLPAESLKALVIQLVGQGLEAAPKALGLIGRFLT